MMNYALQLKMETSTFLGPLFTLNLCEALAGTAEHCMKHYNARTAEQRIRLYTDLLIRQQDQGIFFLFSRLSSHFKLIAKENGNNESLY